MSFTKMTLVFQALAAVLLTTVGATDVATLNRVTFTGNIFGNKEGEGPEGWIVLFCVEWFQPCEKFKPAFLAAAAEHESSDGLFSSKTRFAQVDCAVDKVLCNSQDVDMYPTVVHYRRGGRAGEWSQSGRTIDKETKSFRKWLTKQMEMPDRPLNVVAADEGIGAAGLPAATSFTMGVSVTQSAPMLVAMVASAMWLCRFIPELQQGFQLLRELPGDRSVAAKKEEAQAQLEEPTVEVPIVARSLPEGWARQGSIEL